ncbi:exostosin family protein [Striga asiatica]|uniref:Exostosin family protein n=1 Tax=Striga asiatica TaxID=4170 RepID=A0A5A7QWW3_STRAF|nr:exostosin family protein [Striga asiatica]
MPQSGHQMPCSPSSLCSPKRSAIPVDSIADEIQVENGGVGTLEAEENVGPHRLRPPTGAPPIAVTQPLVAADAGGPPANHHARAQHTHTHKEHHRPLPPPPPPTARTVPSATREVVIRTASSPSPSVSWPQLNVASAPQANGGGVNKVGRQLFRRQARRSRWSDAKLRSAPAMADTGLLGPER